MDARAHAAHVLPIESAPLASAWVDVSQGRVGAVGTGAHGHASTPAPAREIDLGEVVLLPALVNAHTHLELSHLRGRVPPASNFLAWVKTMLAARQSGPPATDAEIGAALTEAERTGTGAIGDIGNTLVAVPALRASGLDAWHFHEVLGFRGGNGAAKAQEAWQQADARSAAGAAEGGRVRCGVAPHAPYSTAPDLIAGVVSALDAAPDRRSSLHLAESAEELQLLADGTGPWRTLLETFGTWDPSWHVPACSPVRYLEDIGALHPRLLIVHATQATADDLRRLAASQATLVLCARSNAWVGAGVPPVADAFAAGCRIAIGTDSLASVANLNLFHELAALRAIAPSVPARALLHAATRGGAESLGFGHLGGIAAGRSARLLVVSLPSRMTRAADVEEWLVSGEVDAGAVRWLDECLTDTAVSHGVAD